MLDAVLADIVLIVHFVFIVLVALGGVVVLSWPWFALAHLPAVCWGAYVSLAGRVCPLTPLEQQLRLAAGQQGYAGGFIDHYLMALIYPAGLSRSVQIALGMAVIGGNLALYAVVLARRYRRAR